MCMSIQFTSQSPISQAINALKREINLNACHSLKKQTKCLKTLFSSFGKDILRKDSLISPQMKEMGAYREVGVSS